MVQGPAVCAAPQGTPQNTQPDGPQPQQLASLDQAWTLAQRRSPEGRAHTLLVREDQGARLLAQDLSVGLQRFPEDSLELVRSMGHAGLQALSERLPWVAVDKRELLPSARAHSHIAAGTNYAAHAREADIDEVFLFPKFSTPSPARSELRHEAGQLLDYEVELCLRADRDLANLADLQAAQLGFFLCGDLTDRAELLRRINTEDLTSGHGFSDAKSGPGRMPTGPYLVVPRDWRRWLQGVRLRSHVNGQLRQDAAASDMLKTPDRLLQQAWQRGLLPLWRYQGRPVPLLESGVLRQGQVLLTGTPEGVVYRAPSLGFRWRHGLAWFFGLSWLHHGPVRHVLDAQIREGLASGRFLQAGDVLEHSAEGLGQITVKIR